MATGVFNITGRYCTQLFIKRLNTQYLQYVKTHRPYSYCKLVQM